MSWWMVPMVVLAAPMLGLAAAGWALGSAFRQVCGAAAPRPEESEWDAYFARGARRPARRVAVPKPPSRSRRPEAAVPKPAARCRRVAPGPWLLN